MDKYFGYGVDLSTLTFVRLKEFIEEYATEDLNTIIQFMGLGNKEITDDTLLTYINSLYVNNGYSGMSSFLSTVINRYEGLMLLCDDTIPDGYIYYPALYPWQLNDTMKKLSLQDAESILIKWLSKITDSKITVENLVMYCDIVD